MPAREFRPEAMTVARWWGNRMRIMVEFVANLRIPDGIDWERKNHEWFEWVKIERLRRVTAYLTEERIRTFELELADIVQAQMDATPAGICVIANGWEPHERLIIATRAARIPLRASELGTFQIFPRQASTYAEPGMVIAQLTHDGSKEHLPLIKSW